MSREISDEQEGQYYELSTEPAGTLSVTGLEKIEPLNPRNVSSEYWNATHENRAKLNEVIENQNKIIDYLNGMVKKLT